MKTIYFSSDNFPRQIIGKTASNSHRHKWSSRIVSSGWKTLRHEQESNIIKTNLISISEAPMARFLIKDEAYPLI